MTTPFATIEQAIADFKKGKMIILMDDEDRENEGDLVIAAEFATSDPINFMASYGRGLICLALDSTIVDRLNLPMMVPNNGSPFGTAFTVSIEAANGVSTGISAQDRARTIQAAIQPTSGPKDIISPGHIFPLRARDRGVLERGGQTEGSVDLAKLAGLIPAAVICEVMNSDGSMSRRDSLHDFAQQHGILMITIKALLDYRITHENLLALEATTSLPLTEYGNFAMSVFSNQLDHFEHFALLKPWDQSLPPLVRIHSECITGDIFGSCKCDCGQQLHYSLDLISREGGILIYLRQEGRGIGLSNKLRAYALQDAGLDTVDANIKLGLPVDKRDYAVAVQILRHFEVKSLKLLTNNPKKVEALKHYGLDISQRIPVHILPTEYSKKYLATKKNRMGHLL